MAVMAYLRAFKSLCNREEDASPLTLDGKTREKPEIASVRVDAAVIFAVDLLKSVFKIVQRFLLNIQQGNASSFTSELDCHCSAETTTS